MPISAAITSTSTFQILACVSFLFLHSGLPVFSVLSFVCFNASHPTHWPRCARAVQKLYDFTIIVVVVFINFSFAAMERNASAARFRRHTRAHFDKE